MGRTLHQIVHFWVWWYKDSLEWFKRFFRNLIVFLDNKMAVSLMLKMLFTPLFHDTSIVGRILSFIFRLTRVAWGGVLMVVTALAMMFWLIAWLMVPILTVAYNGLMILVSVWLVDFLIELSKPYRLPKDGKVKEGKIVKYLSRSAKRCFKKANNNSQVMLEELIQDKEVIKILKRLELSTESFKNLSLILIMEYWLKLAVLEAQNHQADQIEVIHLILALFKAENFRYSEAKLSLERLKREKVWAKTPFLWNKEYQIRPIGGVNRAWTGIPTPTLDKFSTDLTQTAQRAQLPEILGKEEELTKMVETLSRKQRNNLLIIGEPGSGKTTFVKGLAQEIVRGTRARSLRFKRLISLDVAKLASAANSAELSFRMTKIIEEVKASENIILFIDEMHNLATLNQETPETSGLLMALEPPLSEGKFQFIGTTSLENYHKYLEPNEAFTRLLDVLKLEPANASEAMTVLQFEAYKQEVSEGVTISMMALIKMIDLSSRLTMDRVLPDIAVDLLDEVVAKVKSESRKEIMATDVVRVVSEKTKIPLMELTEKEKEALLHLEDKLHKDVVGQDQAILAVANAIRRARTQIKDPSKPIASFMFSGPTGVGKTETAKTLAREFFGDEKMMVRLDMSEFQNLDSINRLIGSPPGQGQANEDGQLTEAIKNQPYTCLLLDEIEKAHPKIINLFLQVLDDARLTDSQGKLVNFSNTIIIATTNVGTREIQEGTQEGKQALEKHFAPEFLNRFTDIIVFKGLAKIEIGAIVKLKLAKLIKQLKKQEVEIRFSEQVIKDLAEAGFSEKWGGRQVDRVIQTKVMNQIATKLLTGEIKKQQLFIVNELS
jgi:ATP-dependent Clp protease ATP-binding subunit ClpC